MRIKPIKMLIWLVVVLACLPFQSASADIGPKPTMDFVFTQSFPGTQVSIVAGTLYECSQADCSEAKPLMEAGPQHFGCEATSCHASAYGFADYHRLEITFSDGKTRQSNIFKTSEFNAQYQVTIRQDDLQIETKLTLTAASPYLLILFCCCCLLAVAAVSVLVIVLARRKKQPE